MFGGKKNKYNSWPNCSECQKMGTLAEKGMRHCLSDGCKVELYWKGGFSEEGNTEGSNFQEELRLGKENILGSSLRRKVRTKRDAKMGEMLKRYRKK